MEKCKEKGLIIYSVGILIVTFLEFILPYRPGILNIILHVLMFSKIPLTFIAILNLVYKNKEAELANPVLAFGILFILFVVDFVSNIFCMFNFYSADEALLKLDLRYFFTLFVLEFLIESIAFLSFLIKFASIGKCVIWAGLSACIFIAIITKGEGEMGEFSRFFAIIALPVRIAMQYGLGCEVADMKIQPDVETEEVK